MPQSARLYAKRQESVNSQTCKLRHVSAVSLASCAANSRASLRDNSGLTRSHSSRRSAVHAATCCPSKAASKSVLPPQGKLTCSAVSCLCLLKSGNVVYCSSVSSSIPK
jgi:hypothetical protein